MIEEKTWLDCPREDLHGIPFMESHGYSPIFSTKDIQNSRIRPSNVPHDPVGFIKDNIHVWKSCKYVNIENSRFRDIVTYWRTAELIDGSFANHKEFDTLDEVVTHYL